MEKVESDKVTLKFDGDAQEYRMEFDFNQVADAESLCGCNLLMPMVNPREMTATQLRGLTFAALKKAHPIVTLEEAGWLIGKHMAMVSDAVAAVYGFTVVKEASGTATSATPI